MFRIGAELSAVATASSGYGLWGATLTGRMIMWSSVDGELGLAWGIGIGHGARILDHQLRPSATLVPYSHVGVESRWHVGSGVLLGLEVLFEHLSVLSGGLSIGYAL